MSNVKVVFAICASSCSIDGRTNAISMFNLLEEATPPSFPAAIPPFTFLIYFARNSTSEPQKPKKVHAEVTLNGKALSDGPLQVDFQSHLKSRMIIEVGTLVLTGPGILKFTVMQGKKNLAEWPIIIRDATSPSLVIENSKTKSQNTTATSRLKKKTKKRKKN